jgi:glutathione S-transferase
MRRGGGCRANPWPPHRSSAGFPSPPARWPSGPRRRASSCCSSAPDDPAPAIARAHALLQVMESELATRPFLAGSEPTLADIANYTYTAHAPEGNVSLQPYPQVRAWLGRIEALPGFVAMARSPVGLAA